MPKPKGCRPLGLGIYIRQIPCAHVITNICHVTLRAMAVFDEPAFINKGIRDLNVGFNNNVSVMVQKITVQEKAYKITCLTRCLQPQQNNLSKQIE